MILNLCYCTESDQPHVHAPDVDLLPPVYGAAPAPVAAPLRDSDGNPTPTQLNRERAERLAREAAPEACPDHNEPWVEGTPCPTCGGKRVWHSGLGSTTTDEHQKCLGTCGMERTVDGIDS